MRDIDKNSIHLGTFSSQEDSISLGWLKLYIINKDSTPSSRTVYIKKDSQIYAVLHTDITGGTKVIGLPATKGTGTNYTCTLDNGDISKICIYPFVVNIHYIDKTTEEV